MDESVCFLTKLNQTERKTLNEILYVRDREWHCVDVHGEDGLFHYGKVVATAQKGLRIDFGCSVGSQLVPFSNTFQPTIWKRTCHAQLLIWNGKLPPPLFVYYDEVSKEPSVQVLLGVRPTEPAKGYDGILIYYDMADPESGNFAARGSYGFVRIALPNGVFSTIVSIERIRWHPKEEGLPRYRIDEGYFDKQIIELPQICSGIISKERLIDVFNHLCTAYGMMATGIRDNKLSVLKVTDKFRGRFDQRYRSGPLAMDGKPLTRLLEQLATENAAQEHNQSGSKMDETLGSHAGEIGMHFGRATTISCLPHHLLLEIFQCLDAVQLANLRQGLRLPRQRHRGDIVPEVYLMRCWDTKTKVVIYENRSRSEELIYDPYCGTSLHRNPLLLSGHLLQLIQRENRLARLNTLVFCNVSWSKRPGLHGHLQPDSFAKFVYWIRNELAGLAAVCTTLLLKNVRLIYIKPEKNGISAESALVHIISGCVAEGTGMTVESMWRMLDDSLPCLSDADFVRLSDHISDRTSSSIPHQFMNILWERQSADPREEVNYRGVWWTRDDLDNLDLRKLTRLTLHSFLSACTYELSNIELFVRSSADAIMRTALRERSK